jgi:hypothetical protein
MGSSDGWPVSRRAGRERRPCRDTPRAGRRQMRRRCSQLLWKFAVHESEVDQIAPIDPECRVPDREAADPDDFDSRPAGAAVGADRVLEALPPTIRGSAAAAIAAANHDGLPGDQKVGPHQLSTPRSRRFRACQGDRSSRNRHRSPWNRSRAPGKPHRHRRRLSVMRRFRAPGRLFRVDGASGADAGASARAWASRIHAGRPGHPSGRSCARLESRGAPAATRWPRRRFRGRLGASKLGDADMGALDALSARRRGWPANAGPDPRRRCFRALGRPIDEPWMGPIFDDASARQG